MERGMKRLRVRFWLLGLTLLGASVVGASRVLHLRADDRPRLESEVRTARSEASAICTGFVDVEGGITSLYPLQPGRVMLVLAHENDDVKAGSVLFRLDDRPAKALLEQAQADLNAARAQLAEARKLPKQHELKLAEQRQAIAATSYRLSSARHIVAQKSELLKKGLALSAEEMAAAEDAAKSLAALETVEWSKLRELELVDPVSQVTRAEADVSAKEARLEQARYALQETALRAPVDGKVLRIFVNAGDVLGEQPKRPAIQFCPAGPRVVRAEVEQEFAGRVAVGAPAQIQDDSTAGPTWHGRVVRLSDWYTHRRSILLEPLQFNDVRTMECIVEIDLGPDVLRIGQRVRVSIGPRP
jgi:multidrug resistance efflux pump